ncbi:MAG: protein-L-isoaspartate O-methyltransferase [Methylobacteriaceae bacterium]|nr:protein-L-isoaspartate O-methyltransferase [Methylobacteriaceae bacterium]
MGETGVATGAGDALRRTMVERQLRTFDVTDLAVLSAFDAVAREAYVGPHYAGVAYSDRALPCVGGKRRLMSPMTLARLIQEADVGPDNVVLDVAGGAGYSAAVLARLARKVVALETEAPTLATGATVVVGPLAAGAPAHAPYDVIVINGVVEKRPEALLSQLAEGGRLVCFERSGAASRAVRYDRFGDDWSRRTLFNAAAPTVEEFRAEPGFVF